MNIYDCIHRFENIAGKAMSCVHLQSRRTNEHGHRNIQLLTNGCAR